MWCVCAEFCPPPPIASKRRVGSLCAALQSVLAAPLAAVVFAYAAGGVFAAGEVPNRTIGTNLVDERAATTGQTGAWTDGVAYDPTTQNAAISKVAALVEEYKLVAALAKHRKGDTPDPEPEPTLEPTLEPNGNASASQGA